MSAPMRSLALLAASGTLLAASLTFAAGARDANRLAGHAEAAGPSRHGSSVPAVPPSISTVTPEHAPALAPTQATPDEHRNLLPEPQHGRAAVAALGTNLKHAAQRNGLSAPHLRRLLHEDDTAWLGRDGGLYYVEAAPSAVSVVAQPISSAALVPATDTFTLHSRPGSQRTIFLDFDGAEVSKTWWNDQARMPKHTHSAFSIDSDVSTFSAAEHAYMQQVWQVVAEKFSAFDVDVTTQDPGSDAYNRSSAQDPTYGVHVLLTSDTFGQQNIADCAGICSGIATVGTFGAVDPGGYLEPAFVFASGMRASATAAANVTAHEVGHTLSLGHDGRNGVAYYPGHDNWTPLMGSGDNGVQQFSRGDYPGATNTQDDLGDIVTDGKLPLAPDDHGDTLGAATVLGARTYYDAKGVIGTRSDVDLFKIDRACTGDLTATASGIGEGSAVDLSVEVLDAAGAVLATANPPSGQTTNDWPRKATGLDASAALSAAPSGSYYVRVDGVGHVPAGRIGYSDYASIGQYTLAVTGCPDATGAPPSAPRDLAHTQQRDTVTLTWSPPGSMGSSPVTGYRIAGLPTGSRDVPASITQLQVSGLTGKTRLSLTVTAINASGPSFPGSLSMTTSTWAPTAPPSLSTRRSGANTVVAWVLPNPGMATINAWHVRIVGNEIGPVNQPTWSAAESAIMVPLADGRYRACVLPLVTADDGRGVAQGTLDFTVGTPGPGPAGMPPTDPCLLGSPPTPTPTPTTPTPTLTPPVPPAPKHRAPSAPGILAPLPGAKRKPITATARWIAPRNSGGTAITSYLVRAERLNKRGKVLRVYSSRHLSPRGNAVSLTLPKGRYSFRVMAFNAVGASPWSARSRPVTAR